MRLALMALFAFSGASLPTHAVDPVKPISKPFSRDDARAVVAQSRRIVSPLGIEEVRQVEIGAITQWISVRGNDRRNPILLHVNGCPGAAQMVEAYGYQRPWEDFLTVVQGPTSSRNTRSNFRRRSCRKATISCWATTGSPTAACGALCPARIYWGRSSPDSDDLTRWRQAASYAP